MSSRIVDGARPGRPLGQPTLPCEGGARLRPWSANDCPALLLAYRDPLIRRYAPALIEDRGHAHGVVATWSGLWLDGAGASWAICSPGNALLGAVVFVLRDAVSGRAETGYWLMPEARGRGLATDALRTASVAVFCAFGWHRLEASHAVGNERSCAVAVRAGYRAEGVLRQSQYYPDSGTWSDEHLHARLAGDVSRW